MNGGLVPLVLLSVTIALMLLLVPRRTIIIGLAALAVAALLGFAIPLGLAPKTVFVGLWLSMIAAAVMVYIPVARRSGAVFPLCAVAGFWLGACAGLSGDRAALALGTAPALLAFAGKSITRGKFDIVIKVVASWMIAIASLSLFVSLIPTPGYEPDHME